jgi:uncharacterized protein YqhQ
MNPRNIFQKISYLQYPLMLVALYYMLIPYFRGFDMIWESYNFALLFMGLSISFSTLQDTTKAQNNLSKKIWQSPKKGKIALVIIALMVLYFILIGLYGIFIAKSPALQHLSYGMIVLGIGIIGLLKAAIEMFENHRLDKNSIPKITEANQDFDMATTDKIIDSTYLN